MADSPATPEAAPRLAQGATVAPDKTAAINRPHLIEVWARQNGKTMANMAAGNRRFRLGLGLGGGLS